MYPRSNLRPSIISSSSFRVFPSLTVITPSLPTFFMAFEIMSPMLLSPLAEMVATWLISSGVVTGLDKRFNSATTDSTALMMPPLFGNSSGQHGRSGGAITGLFVGVVGHVLHKLGTEVLKFALQFDGLGNSDTVFGDLGTSPALFNDHISALGAQSDRHCVRQHVNTLQHLCSRTITKLYILGIGTSRDQR
ncbi:hypothetical protein BpHYR1_018404 [Brachionus plicatilis]|uniref:Uncharacterized protein n=1 Tax=Brachionus plicatilis TaxID=10195 RepID=A0A3M7P6G9_BRAPC|nr:hypothetical protein BpHYR1_018404 [Brachionus plicatilis]